MNAHNGTTIIVTGGLGFIGSHFIDLALSKGYRVVNIDKVTYASNIRLNDVFNESYPDRYSFIREDIVDLKELPYGKYIVHLAAESHVDNAIRDSDIFVRSNVLGTQNLLNLLVDAQRRHASHSWNVELPMFIYVSTDEVFGDRDEGFFKENDRHNPSNPYSASKSMAEMLVLSYGRTYGLPYKITRTTNNYGQRQHHEKLTPNCIAKILAGEKVKIHGSGNQIRNWIYVKDNCDAIWRVMESGKVNETYHIASPEEYSVNDVVRVILNEMGKPFSPQTVEYVQDRSGQDVRYALDYSKTSEELGWQPKADFKSHIRDVIHDYEEQFTKGLWPFA